jgi:4-hydroxy-3-polyprenylbenzoate decarboxylase
MSSSVSKLPVVVGVTGASGAIYARRLIEVLLGMEQPVLMAVSAAGRLVVKEELPCPAGEDPWGTVNRRLLRIFPEKDFAAPFCSGSFRFHGMAVIPASMGTVGAIANGVCLNSIHRGADVALKERLPLVVVPRETPLSAVHIENLLKLARAGAVVLPPAPAFYQRPESVLDLVDFVVSRVLDALGIPNELFQRWGKPAT